MIADDVILWQRFVYYFLLHVQVRDAFRQCCCYCKRGRRGSYWVKGDDVWVQKQPEQLEV